MIKITENGMEFLMEKGRCRGECSDCDAYKFCSPESEVGRMCSTNIYRCTSAKKITSEPKVYGPHNCKDIKVKVGEYVEYWNGSNWESRMLTDINNIKFPVMPYLLNGVGRVAVIRELQTVKKTWSQLQSEIPELANVELIPEDKKENDDA